MTDLSRHLFEELAASKAKDTRASDLRKAEELRARLFQAQRNFVDDPAKRKAALCPRRAGKSFCVLIYALMTALRRARARVLVIARVRRQVKAVYWSDLKRLCEEFEVKAHFRNMELECELPNGSLLLFAGADTAEEIDKYRGTSYDLVCIDEGKSYLSTLLSELIREIIRPTLYDRRGTLAIIGTPGAIPSGPFYAITTGALDSIEPKERGYWTSRRWGDEGKKGFAWSSHHWTLKENEGCPHIWEDALAEHIELGIPDDDPSWLRECLGQWVPDESAMVYAYIRVPDKKADWVQDPKGPHGLPEGHEWRYILGMDIGWHDDTAFVVAAWSSTHPVLHFIYEDKQAHLTVEEITNRVKELEKRFDFDARVADTGGLGKTIVESMSRTYGVHFETARKTEKHDHIKLLNSDLMTGRIKVNPEGYLAEEWRTAQWSGPDRKEVDKDCDDHCSDAALYTWRYAYHHWQREIVVKPAFGTKEWWAEREREEEDSFRDQLQAERDSTWWSKLRNKLDKNEWNSKSWKRSLR